MTEPFRRLPNTDLPVFFRPLGGEKYNLYAPGYIALADSQHFDRICGEFPFDMVSLRLKQAAERALRLTIHREQPPLCLTIYSSLKCNLHCAYCFSDGLKAPDTTEGFIFKNAAEIIQNCQAAGVPFTFVFQGGGEPTFDERLPYLVKTLRKMAETAGIASFGYLTTNGMMNESKAKEIASLFDEIGLSLDGSPEVQFRQRRGSDERSIHSARIFKESLGTLNLRMTVLRERINELPNDVLWLCKNVNPDEIRVEPEFFRCQPEDAAAFCEAFIKARSLAEEKLVRLIYCGTRMNEIHGRYCQIFRGVRQLIPGDGCSVCFLEGAAEQAEKNGRLLPDVSGKMIGALLTDESACRNCFNQYHCTRGCPDICPLSEQKDFDSFRCRVNQKLAEWEITRMTEKYLLPRVHSAGIVGMALYN